MRGSLWGNGTRITFYVLSGFVICAKVSRQPSQPTILITRKLAELFEQLKSFRRRLTTLSSVAGN